MAQRTPKACTGADPEARRRLGGRDWAWQQLGEIDQRIERQLTATEAGVDPMAIGEQQ